MLPLSPAKKRYMFVPSLMSAGSIGLEGDMLPLKSGCEDDQPFALVGSLDVTYANGVAAHSYARTQIFLGEK
jgi:hypothetical protein